MTPRFQLPTGYESRDMVFSLSRDARGWHFVAQANGYQVPALNHRKEPLCGGTIFRTKSEAATMARILALPPYAVWSGRKRAYIGQGAVFRVHARNHPDNLGVS